MTRRDKTGTTRPPTPALDLLRGQARGILATIVAASCWPERFPGRTISARALPEFVKELSDDPDAVRQAVLRADGQFKQAGIRLRRDRTGPRGASSLSLQSDVNHRLEDWLYVEGWRHLRRESWEDFLSSQTSPPRTPEDALRIMDETVARALAVRGRKDEAVAHVEQALSRSVDPRQRIELILARAMALIRRGQTSDWEDAHRSLLRLVAHKDEKKDIKDRIQAARVGVELAYSHFLNRVMGVSDPERVDAELARARAWLETARPVESVLLPAHRARLVNVESLLTKAAAAIAESPLKEELFEDARHGFLSAFTLYHSVADTYGMGSILYNLGELHYVRYRLNDMPDREEPIHEALQWFRASVELADKLDTNRDFVVDYVRIADLLGTLIAVRSRAGISDGLKDLLSEAEANLARAANAGSPIELRLVEWTNHRLTRHVGMAGLRRGPLSNGRSPRRKSTRPSGP